MTTQKYNKNRLNRKSVSRTYLTEGEIDRLDKLYHSGKLKTEAKNALKCFLFCCETGLRYCDARDLKHYDVYYQVVNGKTVASIMIIQDKIQKHLVIPLTDKACKLVDKGPQYQKVFRFPAIQVMNWHLCAIAKLAWIDKPVTFHVARQTFMSRCLSIGIPAEIVSDLLGHTPVKTTKVYAVSNGNTMERRLHV